MRWSGYHWTKFRILLEVSIKTSSKKNKGRRLQYKVRDDLLAKGAVHGLKVGDVVSRSMGAAGEDLMMSPKAMEVFPFVIECKNCESLNVRKVFDEHYSKYDKRVGLKMLVHSKNHS